ncbi:MAG: glycosyltransferase family 2 protein [Gammaproteobacteria bacterium]|nr:glycosyltransferase family 2 protein [Gammaproteobacteria bacterium]
MSDTSPRFSVVIPCYNEADNIVALVEEVVQAMRELGPYEVVVVDDCSNDGSQERLRAALPRWPGVLRVVAHAVNRGQSAALCSGVDAARGEWIATLDGDGQNDPADIPALVARIPRPGEAWVIICGHRKRRRDTWVRRLSSKVANGVRSRALGDATPDTGCGLKVFPRRLFLLMPRFDHMHRFMPALAQRCGAVSTSVEVNHRPRLHGQSKYGIGNRLWVGIVDLFGVMWLRRRAFRASSCDELGP